MKKSVSLLITLSLFVLTACGPAAKSDTASSIPLEASDSALSETLPLPTVTPSPTATPAPVPVYSDGKVTISYAFTDSDGVHFYVQNQTDVNITIQANSVSINGFSQNDIIMSDDVAPQSTGEVIAKCIVDPNIAVETIGGQLRIIDFNNSFETYTATFINVPVTKNASSSLPEVSTPDYPLLYEDEKVSIYYVSIDNDGVHFQVQNNTDVNITIQADSLALNGLSVNDIIMSDSVAPRSLGEIIAKCSVNVSNPLETLSGQLRIIDFDNSFKTYDASFVNVPVTDTSSVQSPLPSDDFSDISSAEASYTSSTDFLTRLEAIGTVKDLDSNEDIPDFKGIAFYREDSNHSTPLYYKTDDGMIPLVIARVDNLNDPQDELLTLSAILLCYRPQLETEDILLALSSAIQNEDTSVEFTDNNVAIIYSSENSLNTLWITDPRVLES